MSAEKFKFAPLSAEFIEMAEELEQLGGGSVAVGGINIVGIVQDASRDKVLWPQPHGLSIRDPAVSSSSPVDQSVKFYPMSECYASSTIPSGADLPVVGDIMDWISQGFCANLVSYGQGLAGKSKMLLGEGAQTTSNSVFGAVLRRIFEFSSEPRPTRTIGMSAWQLLGRGVFDLFAEGQSELNEAFVAVECPDFDTATSLLIHAQRQASRNQSMHKQCASHLFLKLYIQDHQQAKLSHIHVADLTGRVSAELQRNNSLSPLDRELSLQHAALTKVFQQLRMCKEECVISAARESKLAEMMFHILTDNAKTWILAFFRDGEEHFSASQSTLQTLSRLTEVKLACRHISSEGGATALTFCSPSSVLRIRDMPNMFPSATSPPASPTSPILDLHALARSTVQSPADVADELFKWLAVERTKPSQFPITTDFSPDEEVGATVINSGPQESACARSIEVPLPTDACKESQPNPGQDCELNFGPSVQQVEFAATSTTTMRWKPTQMSSTNANVPQVEHSQNPELAQVMGEFRNLMESLTMDELKARVSADSASTSQSNGTNDRTRLEIDNLLRELENRESSRKDLQDEDEIHSDSLNSTPRRRDDASPHNRYSGVYNKPIGSSPAWTSSNQDQSTEHEPLQEKSSIGDELENSRIQAYDHMSLDVLKANYDTLLHALEEEQRRRVIANEKASLLEQEFQEKETQYQLLIDTLKVSEVRLRSQLRKMASEHSLNKAFDDYERELGRVRTECEQIKERNIVLELQLAESYQGLHVPDTHLRQPNSPVLKSTALMKSSLKKLQKENTELRHKLEKVKRNERQQLVSSRVARGASQKVHQLSAKLTEVSDALQREQLASAKAVAELQRARDAITSASHQEMILRNENAMMGERIVALQQKVYDYELDQKRRLALEKCSKKHAREHADNARARPSGSPSRSFPMGNQQQHAPEANATIPLDLMLQLSAPQTAEVLVALQENVKRLAPGLMPLVTKLRTSLVEEQAGSAQSLNGMDFLTQPANSRIPPAASSQWNTNIL